MTLTFTILGCASSAGVPRPALGWGVCDPTNPKNRRRRCSLLVQRRGPGGVTRLLVDTSPDLREQLLDTEVDWLDAVLITHQHADHIHGVDDLRSVFIHGRRRLDMYLDEPTARMMHERFGYCFVSPPGSDYPPILNEHRLVPGRRLNIEGAGGTIPVLPLLQHHGDIDSLGFRFGDVAYCCDLKDFAPASVEALYGLDVLIIDALRYKQHPSHLSVAETLAWIERLRPRHAILTNLHSDLDYETLRGELPKGVEPAFDGLAFEVEFAQEKQRASAGG
jgi:phosphoribosyl 1,2-cyclic phosphate phosphodiesterase